ncbi:unnamed protein product, partial [Didymodactylos carnosus]
EGRLELANFSLKRGVPVGCLTAGAVTGAAVLGEAFGGVGVLIVAGIAFSPVTSLVCASVIDGVAVSAVKLLINRFWANHQHKALGYLNKIFEGLVQLKAANLHFMRYMTDAEEKANQVSEEIKDIQLCLISERQRRANRAVCTQTMK